MRPLPTLFSAAARALALALLLSSAACDDADDGPAFSDADRARCAHIDREAELGEYLYSTCLSDPWPTEIPGPPTQSGESYVVGWINDTLALVNGNPSELRHKTARAARAYEADLSESPYRIISGGRSTWREIDPRGAGIRLPLYPDGSIAHRSFAGAYLNITAFGPHLDGRYYIDTATADIRVTRWDERIVAGTIDARFVDPDDPERVVTFTNGYFDVLVR